MAALLKGNCYYCLLNTTISLLMLKAHKFTNGKNPTVLTSHDVDGILNSKVQSDNGSDYKAAVTQGVSKPPAIKDHLYCSWRLQSSKKL